MPENPISIKRVARDAVRIDFDPGNEQGTALFIIDLARDIGGTMDHADRTKVLLKAQAVASAFIDCVNRELHADAHRT